MRSCFLAGASEQGAVYGCKWNLESLAVLLPCTELHGGSAKGKVARQNPTLHNGDIIEHGTPCRRFSAGSIIPIMIKLAGPDRPRVLAARCPVPTPASKARRKLFMQRGVVSGALLPCLHSGAASGTPCPLPKNQG